MVAIVVILSAVIAAFVLDLGSNLGGEPVNAVIDENVDEDDDTITLTLEENQNADSFVVRGDTDSGDSEEISFDGVGDQAVLSNDSSKVSSNGAQIADSGDIRIVAKTDGGDESVVGEVDWSF